MRPAVAFIITVILMTMIWHCTADPSGKEGANGKGIPVVVRGTLRGGGGQQVILEEMAAREYIPLDTVICDEKGGFALSFFPAEVAFYVLRYGKEGYVTLLLEPGDSLLFTGDMEDPGPYRVEGPEGSELLAELSAAHQEALDQLRRISTKNRELSASPRYRELKPDLDRQFDSVTRDFRDYSLGFIRGNPGSLAILVALYNLYGEGLPVFDPLEDLDVYRFTDSVLSLNYAGFEAVDLLHAQVTRAARLNLQGDPGHGPGKGDMAPDFVSSRPDGSQLALSELRGNYVLLYFWAGWSRPSRDENPVLKSAAELYGKYNFRILQVSLDDNREVWTGAIRDDRLEGEQVSDLKRWDTPVADLYGIERIPSMYLIGPTGQIIGVDLFGEELLGQLESIFSGQ